MFICKYYLQMRRMLWAAEKCKGWTPFHWCRKDEVTATQYSSSNASHSTGACWWFYKQQCGSVMVPEGITPFRQLCHRDHCKQLHLSCVHIYTNLICLKLPVIYNPGISYKTGDLYVASILPEKHWQHQRQHRQHQERYWWHQKQLLQHQKQQTCTFSLHLCCST